MIILLVILGLLCILALAAGVYLYIRLRRREADIQAVLERPRQPDGMSGNKDDAAIDQFLYDRCCRYMTERQPFLVESFSLGDLAAALFTNKSYLSRTINRYSGKNFRQYLNYYRVMYAMELFRRNRSLKVNQLAELSGFRSATSFLNAFKALMKEPPSEWCARVRRKLDRPDRENK